METSDRQKEYLTELLAYVAERYGISPDYPWIDEPDYAVLRHADGGKWFAVIMLITARRLGLYSDEPTYVLNVKCDPALIGSLIDGKAYFPAYHMNKEHWLSVKLDGSAPEEEVCRLIDLSFGLTERRIPKAKKSLPKD